MMMQCSLKWSACAPLDLAVETRRQKRLEITGVGLAAQRKIGMEIGCVKYALARPEPDITDGAKSAVLLSPSLPLPLTATASRGVLETVHPMCGASCSVSG